MAGAHIFVMYADGNNNVTLSARDGNQGHVEPVFDRPLFSGIELLEGSGVSGGVMTANVKCAWIALHEGGSGQGSMSADSCLPSRYGLHVRFDRDGR